MSTRKPKPRGRSFARGNKAAAKGEPRTVPLSVRLPLSTAEKLARLAYGRGSRADVLIELIRHAPTLPHPEDNGCPAVTGTRYRTSRTLRGATIPIPSH
ncbi:MAG: hypothetical protein BWX70_03367 [Verrucomicrobia bacterium ADurb.Bin070]|nr:MAG: hypothetical protein BWX70_03367 [Verrucomicrobia bacterium ADurb.Bin070]